MSIVKSLVELLRNTTNPANYYNYVSGYDYWSAIIIYYI